MPRKGQTEDQIVAALRQVEAGAKFGEVRSTMCKLMRLARSSQRYESARARSSPCSPRLRRVGLDQSAHVGGGCFGALISVFNADALAVHFGNWPMGR